MDNNFDINDGQSITEYIKQNSTSKKIFNYTTHWMPDDAVNKCNNCLQSFGTFIWRHHCRLCGNIFCYKCVNNTQTIPEHMLPVESKKITMNEVFTIKPYEKKIVCTKCNDYLIKMKKVENIVESFNNIELDIMGLYEASNGECELWRDAAEVCMNDLMNIQKKMAYYKYTETEKRILWRNAKYFHGHSKYLMALLKSCNTDEEVLKVRDIIEKRDDRNIINHTKLLCIETCMQDFTSIDLINILAYCLHNNGCDELKKYIFENLKCGDIEFKCYIPLIVHYIKDDDKNILINELFKRCDNKVHLLNSIYLELLNYITDKTEKNNYKKAHDIMMDHILKNNDPNINITLLEGKAFINVIQNIGKSICNEGKTYEQIKDDFKLTSDITYPLNIERKIKKIIIEDIKLKDSATKPVIIPCLTSNENITRLMYKKENLRQDQIMMIIINLVDIIIKKDLDIDLNLITYDILPITKNSGIIEIVDNADTIYYIKEKLNTSIQNYMMDKNPSMTIGEFRDRYIKSIAGYSVITYLFGVGDRHLDNIMVSRDGRLFHIDYGFILGHDPVFNNPGIRITPDMLEAIGNLDSEYYIKFHTMASQIYNSLRKHIDIFMNMLLLLKNMTENMYDENEIINQISKRFLPSETDINAKFHIVKTLETQCTTDRIKDFFHFHKKEQTLSTAMNRFSYAMSNLVNIFGSPNKYVYNNAHS